MNLVSGFWYNFRGLRMGLKTPRLLLLGMIRFAVVVLFTLAAVGLVLAYYQEILSLVWNRPESPWIAWLWHLISWIVLLLLVVGGSVLAYLVSQLVFAIWIMDRMSRITERLVTGQEKTTGGLSFWQETGFLIKQEIPRSILPVGIAMLLMILGWTTLLGPLLSLASTLTAAVFLSWDNTDLVPARRHYAFGERWRLLKRNIPFHLGFGLWFLIPGLNILFLSFAPVGATLYFLEKQDR